MTVQLALGTVQFGLAYGVVGRSERVADAEAAAILAHAAEAGITTLDTAAAYGDIEQRLAGLCGATPFEIVSKVPPLPAEGDAAAFVAQAVQRSAERLGPRLAALLFHRAGDLLGPQGDAAWRAAADALPPGVKLGVSAYGPDELARVAARHPVAIAQLPGNALDQRLHGHAFPGIELHLRSVFLQGLLLAEGATGAARVPACAPALAAWQRWCGAQGLAPIEAALGLARALPGVSRLVVGVDDLAQLRAIHAAWQRCRPLVAPELAQTDPAVIDPRFWKHP